MFTAATIVISGLPNVYESRALIAVTPLEKDRLSSPARITAVTQELTSTPNLAAVAKSENVFGPVSSDAEVTRSVAVLSNGITLDTKYRGSGPESITISYRDTDPKRAQRVVKQQVYARHLAACSEKMRVRYFNRPDQQVDIVPFDYAAASLRAVDTASEVELIAPDETGKLADTAFVFTSDHGYFYGEHGLSVERRLAYEERSRTASVPPSPADMPGSAAVHLAHLEALCRNHPERRLYVERDAPHSWNEPFIEHMNAEIAAFFRGLEVGVGGWPEAQTRPHRMPDRPAATS